MSHTYTKPSNKTVTSRRTRGQGRGKTSHQERKYYNLQLSNEENCEYNVPQEERSVLNEYRGNHCRSQQGSRGNSNLCRNAYKRPLSSRSRSSAPSYSSEQANSYQSEQKKNMMSLNSKLPVHAQSSMFLEQILPRFNSILPRSELLEPETSVVKSEIKNNKTDHSLGPNSSHGFCNSRKSPHQRFRTCESHFSEQSIGILKGECSESRTHSFAFASNDFSQGYENSRNKSPHRSFPASTYNLPSIPLGCDGSENVNKTFASISNNVSNRFQKKRSNSPHEKPFTFQYSEQDRLRAELNKSLVGNKNSGSAQDRKDLSRVAFKSTQQKKFNKLLDGQFNNEPKFAMSLDIVKREDSQISITKSSSASNNINKLSDPNVHCSGSVLEQSNNGMNHSERFVGNENNFKTSSDACGKQPKGVPNLSRSSFQNNLGKTKPSNPSESITPRNVSKSAAFKNDLINAMKQAGFKFNDHENTFPKANTNTSTTISKPSHAENLFPKANTNTSTTISKPSHAENLSLGSRLLHQLDSFESNSDVNTLKLTKTNSNSPNNLELPKPDYIHTPNQKLNYSNKRESKVFPPSVVTAKSETAVSLKIPRQGQSNDGSVDYQKPSNFSKENLKNFHLECDSLNIPSENNNSSFSSTNTSENISLTDYTLTGQSFDIRQPARDSSHRAPSRTEVMERLVSQYAIKAAEHAEKERLKQEKKRDEYLAKYKHVDQGHKLYEGYLDEAVGYDPRYFETEENIRQRQQQQLAEDALVFQEREREKNEKLKRREQERANNCKRNICLDAGYTLGRNDKNENKGYQAVLKSDKTLEPPDKSPEPKNTDFDFKIPEEILIKGQSVEEALELQEQLLQEGARMKAEETSKKKQPSSSRTPLQLPQSQDADEPKPVYKTQFPNPVTKEVIKVPKLTAAQPNKSSPVANILSRTDQNLTAAQPNKSSPVANILSRTDQNLQFSIGTNYPMSMSKEKPLPQLIKQELKNDSNTPPMESSASSHSGIKLMNPVSCVLNKPTQGPVLVLRATEEALQKALLSHQEIQDEMDKCGFSSSYKPNVEKALFVHNKFERKGLAEIEKDFGVIYKQPETIQPSVNVTSSDQAESNEPEAVMDLKAEMRAARLRMQQKYDENLKKQKENLHE